MWTWGLNSLKLLPTVRASAVSTTVILIPIGSKGKAADMMKDSSKRKRTRKEMEEVKEFEQSLKEDRQQFLQDTKRLKQERDQMQEQIIELSQVAEMAGQMFSQGVADGEENEDMPNLGGDNINQMLNMWSHYFKFLKTPFLTPYTQSLY